MKMVQTRKIHHYITIPFSICPSIVTAYMMVSILNAILPILIMMVTAEFLDSVAQIVNISDGIENITKNIVLLSICVVASHICKVLGEYIRNILKLNLSKNMRMRVVEKRVKLPLSVLENEEQCDFIERVSEECEVRFYSGLVNLTQLAEYLIRGVGFLVIVGVSMPILAIFFAVVAYVLFKVALACGKEDYSAFQKTAKIRRYTRDLRLMLCDREYVEERSLFHYSEEIEKKWRDNMQNANHIELKAVQQNAIHTKNSNIITVLLSMTVALVLLFPMKEGKLTIGLYLALVQQVMNLVETLTWKLNPLIEEFEENRNYLEDYLKFCDMDETEEVLEKRKIGDIREIRFEHVNFRYPGTEKEVLKDFTYTFNGQKSYAIVGVNGAGKTTLIKLLLGFYDNYSGKIFINGVNINELDLKALRRNFSVVYQDFARFPITIREFLQLGKSQNASWDQEKVDQILDGLKLQKEVESLPLKLDTPLGKLMENGSELSGGQWQKLAIARCMLSDASVRILDEPTAAIDPVSEAKLHDTFEKMSRDYLTITVTHRLGLAKKLQEIVVISDGSVVESGSHEKLLSEKGIYAKMYETQRRWYQDEAELIS